MNKPSRCLSSAASNVISKHFSAVALKLALCVIAYSVLIVNDLVNIADGLWYTPNYTAGIWEISLGRWMLPYLDALRFGFSMNPIHSILALFVFVLGTEVFAAVFSLRKSVNILLSLLFLISVSVCNTLTYRFCSASYACAFLFSILCVWFIQRRSALRSVQYALDIIFGALFLAMVVGSYQIYIGCTTLCALGLLMLMLLHGDSWVDIGAYLFKGVITALLGLVLYLLVWKLEMARFHISASDYNGLQNLSAGSILASLPDSLRHCYGTFIRFYRGNLFHQNAFDGWAKLIMIGLSAALPGLFMVVPLFKKDRLRLLCLALCAMLFPITANIVILLVPEVDSLALQMLGAITFSIPLLLSIPLSERNSAPASFLSSLAKGIACILSVVLLCGNMQAVLLDQMAMNLGTNATKSLTSQVLADMIQDGTYPDPDHFYAFVGSAYENDLFMVPDLYDKANGYAQMGNFLFDGWMNNLAWSGVFKNLLGIRVNMIDNSTYDALLQSDAVAALPAFPAEGYAQLVDDIIVVRISR